MTRHEHSATGAKLLYNGSLHPKLVLTSRMHKPPLRYSLLLLALSPVVALLVLWQAWQARSSRFALQRLGFAYGEHNDSPLWIHCASVGEVRAALPLIEQLRLDLRFAALTVSTATPTGADTIAAQSWPDVRHVFLPVDFQSAVQSAFKAIKPSALLLMETEIWPNLINTASRQDVPVVIVNGRLSPRTSEPPKWLLPVYHQALSKVTTVLAKSDDDARNFIKLGTHAEAVVTLGNLKFAASSAHQKPQAKPFDRPFWLAASTHDDEELQLCKAWLTHAGTDKALLVLAPRHPKRSEKIQQQLRQLNLKLAVRSHGQHPAGDTDIYLADTLGEMPLWLQHAQAVFMGGSLVPVGGHNLLEPAAHAKPIVSGPHLHNFLEESALLRQSGALQVVQSADQAIEAIALLLEDAKQSAELGEAGRQALRSSQDVLERYKEALVPLIARQQ